MSYRIGICDNEEYQIKVNELFLNDIATRKGYDLECCGFKSGSELRTYLQENTLDVVFLDIDMPGESGIQVAEWLAKNYPNIIVVFATGHREFAEEAFEVEAAGYLVKPYDVKRLEPLLEKVILRILKKNQKKISYEIVITDENLKKKIDVRNIMYIERCQAKSIIVTQKREYQVYETMSSLYERIGKLFIRVNQGEIVNRAMIAEIKENTVYLKNGMQMAIGRTFRKEVMKKYFGE